MKRLNICFLIAIGLNLAIRHNPARPNIEVLPEMVHSPACKAFSPNPNFPDGKTLQPPVPGTIARGMLPVHFLSTPEDAVRAGEQLVNPISMQESSAIERGASVYQTFCTPCHGPGGKGDGAVAQRGYPAPPSLLAEKASHLKDGQMFHILTYGRKNMPSYAGQISAIDRWRVILYVRSMQRDAQAAAATGQRGPQMPGAPAGKP
jgi:mono/diheme cytochrome c family protein